MTINHSTNWDGIRHTDKKAVPMSHNNVRNAYVVWVEEATIRGAVIKNQHLEVAERSTIGALFQGKPSVEVFCTWYGRKPLTSWMHIKLRGKIEVKKSYTGPVLRDIRRPA